MAEPDNLDKLVAFLAKRDGTDKILKARAAAEAQASLTSSLMQRCSAGHPLHQQARAGRCPR